MEGKISAPVQLDWTGTNLTESILCSSTQDTVTISAALNNMSTTSPYTVTGAIGTNYPNAVYTTGTVNNVPWMTSTLGQVPAPKIKLDGEGADIVVNGHSLVDAINSIQDRLNCLQINPALEKEWNELRALGDQYRELEKQILEKQATWDRLRAMPPPDID